MVRSKVVLSVTPGFYSSHTTEPTRLTLGYLHRPSTIDRYRVPEGCTILACPKAFDEILTVGYNVVLASKLGVVVEGSLCLQEYKGDTERCIAIVG